MKTRWRGYLYNAGKPFVNAGTWRIMKAPSLQYTKCKLQRGGFRDALSTAAFTTERERVFPALYRYPCHLVFVLQAPHVPLFLLFFDFGVMLSKFFPIIKVRL